VSIASPNVSSNRIFIFRSPAKVHNLSGIRDTSYQHDYPHPNISGLVARLPVAGSWEKKQADPGLSSCPPASTAFTEIGQRVMPTDIRGKDRLG